MQRSTTAVQPVERFFEFSLLGLLASGYFAVVGSGFIDLPTTAATAAALILRALTVAGLIRLDLSTRFINALTLLYIGFYPLDYLYVSGEFLPATVHLIFFLAALRVLTASSNRDYFFVKLIALLELLAAAILSSSLNFFAFLALFLFSAVCTFAASEIRRSSQLPRRISRSATMRLQWRLAGLTTATAAGILLMTAGLFFLLPRTARAAFRHLVPERYHLAGFSNEVELGDIGEIQRTSTPVMHVRFEAIEHALHLKWRGAALMRFDGRRWYNPPELREKLLLTQNQISLANPNQLWRPGARISYEIALGPIDSDVLFFLGVPEFLRIGLRNIYRSTTDSYHTGLGYGEGVRYFALSYLPQEIVGATYDADALTARIRQDYLQLPATDVRIYELARRVAGAGGSDYDRAAKLERHLRTEYGYTTELLRASVPDPLAHFLFERRKGHCEYFASAMAVMLRQLGIPARVVTGFQSGTYNHITGWHVIRTSDAHSWVEAYLERRGWSTFDPTPPDPRPQASGFWLRLAMIGDAADTFWREWVLDYDKERQVRTLNLGSFVELQSALQAGGARAAATMRDYGLTVVLTIAGLACLVVIVPRVRASLAARRHERRVARGDVSVHDATLLYNRALAALRKRGFEKPPWLTPAEFAAVLPASRESVVLDDLTAAYHQLRYGGHREAAVRMLALVSRLEAPSRT
ncbi:MAG TPA: DUF3488 and transglutaminase-like domain-containing protein [Bryobacteraceae bacterium]|nr:DUF3488 and transglutaminase-like domain-containing protein [Bryobacteraceae bacterium]